MAVTWNPSDKSTYITLSNGDLTATATNTVWKSVRAISGKSSGKWYWEITISAGISSNHIIGAGTLNADINNSIGGDTYGYGYNGYNGEKYHNTVSLSYGSTFGLNDIIGIALDLDNGKIWWSKNGVWQASGDPVAGTNEAYSGLSGTFYPMYSPYASGKAATANFGASAFTHTVPSGFTGLGASYAINANNVECLTQVTNPAFTVRRAINANNVESLTEVTAPSLRLIGELDDVSSLTQITSPTLSVFRNINASNVESLTQVDNPSFGRVRSANASDVSALTQITAPTLSKSINASDVESSSEITASLLSFHAVIDATLPMITCDIQGGHGGFMEGTLPCITAEMRGGAILEATLPMITAEITGKTGIVGELEVTLPRITASMTGKTEILGEIEATLPMIRAYITGKTGEVGELNVTLPMITCDIQGYFDITGELEATLPLIKAYMVGTLDRFAACDVLRFIEPAVTKSLTLSDVESAPSIGAASL